VVSLSVVLVEMLLSVLSSQSPFPAIPPLVSFSATLVKPMEQGAVPCFPPEL